MKFLFTIFICGLSLILNISIAQEFVFEGVVSNHDGGTLGSVTISAKSSGNEVAKVTSDAQGKYKLTLPINKQYEVVFSKSGFVSKMMTIDARDMNEEDLPIGGEIMPPVNLDLFTNREGADFSFLRTTPVVDWKYFPREFKMAWDENRYKSTKKKIDDALAQAEKAGKENEAKFNKLVADADKLFQAENYQEALDKYEEAIKIPGKGMEPHPNSQILAIEDLLTAQRKEELVAQQANQRYQNLIDAAEILRKNEEYDKAINKFYEAHDENPDEEYPLIQIDELQDLLKEKKKRQEYESLIEMADRFYEQNSMQAARDKYERALKLYPEEDHPRLQLEKMENALKAEQQLQERKKKYNEALEAADKLFDDEKYQESIDKYNEALTYEDASDYPKQRIDLAQEFIDKAHAENEKQEKYDDFIAQGDAAMIDENFEEAIEAFNEALNIFGEKDYPKTQIRIADNKLKALKEQELLASQLDELFAKAEENTKNEEWQEAIRSFDAILALDENNSKALEGKKNAEEALEKKEEESELKTQFENLIADADELFEKEEYDNAKSKYKEADALIAGNETVKEQIEKIDELIKELESQQELQNKINNYFSEAKSLEEKEEWANAQAKYQKVLELDKDNSEALAGIEKAKAKILEGEELAQQKEKWDNLMAEAQGLIDNGSYEDAKVKLLEAQKLEESSEITELLTVVEDRLKAIEAADQQKEALVKLLADAKSLYDQNKWQDALAKYKEALEIEKSEEVENKIAEIEAQIDAEREAEAIEEEIAKLVSEGDEFMANEQYQEALDKFKDALSLKDDTDVQTKKLEAETALKDLSEGQQIDLAFEESLNKGQEAMEIGSWDEAIIAFQDALSLKPDNKSADSKLNEAKEGKQKQKDFDELVGQANVLEGKDELEDAISKYQEALAVINDNEIQSKVEQLKEKKEQNELANIDDQFTQHLNKAKGFDEEGDIDAAIAELDKALKIKENDDEARVLLEAIKEKKKNQEIAEKELKEIGSLLTKGEKAIDDEDYATAIDVFQNVLELDETNEKASEKLEIAKVALKKLEEEEDQYQQILKEADELMSKEDYLAAKEKYEVAKEIKKSDPIPQTKIVAIDDILRKKEDEEAKKLEAEKIQVAFEEIMEKAAKVEGKGDFDKALELYKEASELKENEKSPKDKIEAISSLLAQQKADAEEQAAYDLAMKRGKESMAKGALEESISAFQKALEIKENDATATAELSKAKAAFEVEMQAQSDEKFSQEMLKVTQAVANELYDDALVHVNKALDVKPEDENATEQKKAIIAEIDRIEADRAAAAKKKNEFDGLLSQAKSASDIKDYPKAYELYDEALNIFPNDADVKLKKAEAKRNAKAQLKEKEDKVFEELLAKANSFFENDELEDALALYEQAEQERPSDSRANIKAKEIKRILNRAAKAEAGLDYLGEEEDISIVEGALLLEKAERTRAALKKQRVVNKLEKQEDVIREASLSDTEERLNLMLEADRIRDLRNEGRYENNRRAQELSVEIDNTLFEIAEKLIQDNAFERGSVLRQNEQIVYVNDAYRDVNVQKRDRQYENNQLVDKEKTLIADELFDLNQRANTKYLDNDQQISTIIDQQVADRERSVEMVKNNANVVRDLEEDKILLRAEENRINSDKWLFNNEHVSEVIDLSREDVTRSNEMRRVNADRVQSIQEDLILQSQVDQKENYSKLQSLQQKSVQAEIDMAESKESKLVIQKAIEEDIRRVTERQQDQLAKEREEIYAANLRMDAYLVEQQESYLSSIAESDNRRKQTVEQVKQIEEERDQVFERANSRKQKDIYHNMDRVERIQIQQEEGLEKLHKDMRETQSEIQRALENSEQVVRERQNEKARQQKAIERDIERTQVTLQETIVEKNQIANQNAEYVDSEAYLISAENQRRQEESKKKNREVQGLLDQIEANKIQYTELVANTLGDEFPDGVTQEVYVRRDKDDLPIEIVTRRIVVRDGRGDVYLRVQRRNIITYSKNGIQITETGWNNGTENAKLVRHF